MPRRFLLDTSALIAHFRRESGWDLVQSLFEESDTELLAASVTLTEFARRLRELGATVVESRQRAEEYKELLDDVVAVDEKSTWCCWAWCCLYRFRHRLCDYPPPAPR